MFLLKVGVIKMPKTIKEIINNKINKDEIYDKIINHKDKKIVNYRLALTSFVLIILVSVYFIKLSNKSNIYNSIIINKEEISIDEIKNNNDFNLSTYSTTSAMKTKFNLSIPSNLINKKVYRVYAKKDKESLSYFHEYNIIYFDKDENSYIKIAFSKEYEPFTDDLSNYSIDESISILNNETLLYKYNEYYSLKFNYHNYNYYINSKNISKSDLMKLIYSIKETN